MDEGGPIWDELEDNEVITLENDRIKRICGSSICDQLTNVSKNAQQYCLNAFHERNNIACVKTGVCPNHIVMTDTFSQDGGGYDITD